MKANTQPNKPATCGQHTPRVSFLWDPKCSDGAPGVTIHFDVDRREDYEAIVEVERALLKIGVEFDTGSAFNPETHRLETRDWEFDGSLTGEHLLWDEAAKTYHPIEARKRTEAQ